MKIFTTLLFLLSYCSLLLLGSCGDKDTPITNPNTEIEISTRTYETNVIGESTFYNLWLIVYDDSNNVEYCRDLLKNYTGGTEIKTISEIIKHIPPGDKTFYALGNVPTEWETELQNAESTQTLNLASFVWTQNHLPRLKTKPLNKEKFEIDPAYPMRFSGKVKKTIIADVPNYVSLPLLRTVGKLEVELVPAWKEKGEIHNITEIDFLKENCIKDGSKEAMVVNIKNRAMESKLLEEDVKIDPAHPSKVDTSYSPDIYAYKDINGEMTLAYEDKTTTPAIPAKTIKTIPVYFYENHPAFTTITDSEGKEKNVFQEYKYSKHPFIDIKINTDQGGGRLETKLNGKLIEEPKTEIEGIFRNFHYHLTLGVFLDDNNMFMLVEVENWDSSDKEVPPIVIPRPR